MDKLLKLEEELKKAREELIKLMSSDTTAPGSVNSTGGTSIGSQIGFGKKEHMDEEEDKEIVAEALDQHNEKKHGEKKSKNSAQKDMGLKKKELMKSLPNGQWSLGEAQ